MNSRQVKFLGWMIVPVHILIITIALNCVNNVGQGVFAIMATCGSLLFSIIFYLAMDHGVKFDYIEKYEFPDIVIQKFRQEQKYLSDHDVEKVKLGLKQFFYAYAYAPASKEGLMMPSRIVDELWHQFMLDSRNYADFCDKAFGKMLHHKPGLDTDGNKKIHLMKTYPKSLYNTYNAVKDMSDKKYLLAGIPILFALDSELNVDNGFHYNEMVLANVQAAMKNNATSNESSSSGSCGGFVPAGTISSCGSNSSSSSCSSCGGGCGGD